MSASDPAVVCMRSAVPMLSLISTGMPCNGPRTLPAFRSASRLSAIASASGLTSRTERRAGLFSWRPSIASIRARYFSASERAESSPDSIRF